MRCGFCVVCCMLCVVSCVLCIVCCVFVLCVVFYDSGWTRPMFEASDFSISVQCKRGGLTRTMITAQIFVLYIKLYKKQSLQLSLNEKNIEHDVIKS